MSLMKMFAGTILIGMILQFGLSCSPSKPGFESLQGKWDIQEAKRNGRITQTLENVYFNFEQDSIMQTNIFGSVQDFTVKYTHPKIEIEGSHLKEINVILVEKDTLVLSAYIRDFRYDLSLLRTKP